MYEFEMILDSVVVKMYSQLLLYWMSKIYTAKNYYSKTATHYETFVKYL